MVKLLLEEIAADYGVIIGMIIQPTHRFDFNGPDALYHNGKAAVTSISLPPLSRAHSP